MGDWFEIKAGEPLPTVPQYLLVGGDPARTRSARYFSNLTKVKSAITNTFAWGIPGRLTADVLVYEWDGTGWQEIYALPKGTSRLDHPLWKNGPAPKTPQVVSEVDVSEALASILGTNKSEED